MQNPDYPTDHDKGGDEAKSLGNLLTTPNPESTAFEVVEDTAAKAKRKPKPYFDIPNLRLYLAVITLAGLTTLIVGSVLFATVSQRTLIVTPTFNYPTNPPIYGSGFWDWNTPLLTANTLGSIPLNAQVWIKDMQYDSNALDWHYTVRTAEGVEGLAWSWEIMPMPTPTPTIFPFAREIGMGAVLFTTEAVGAIPANSRVRISHATDDGQGGWWYTIVTYDESITADVRDYQLTYAPGYTPGATPTAALMTLAGDRLEVVTLVEVDGIPANTRVRVSGGHFDGIDWVYNVNTEDGRSATMFQSQLAYTPQ